MNFVGIDIGVTGGIAIIKDCTNIVGDMPTTVTVRKGKRRGKSVDIKRHHYDTEQLLAILRAIPHGIVVMEQLSSMPHDGKVQAFSLGHGAGLLEGICIGLGLNVIKVPPQTWKRHFGLLKKDKDASIDLAREKFPDLAQLLTRKKDHGRAEALLLALYAKETHEQ